MSSLVEDNLPFNLEHYLSRLTLQPIIHGSIAPPMPPPKKRSTVTPVTLKPGGYRKLRELHRFNLTDRAVQYFSKLKSVQEDVFRVLNLAIQLGTGDLNSDFSPFLINDSTNLVHILYRFLLQSAQTILETLDNSMCDWSFKTISRPRSNPAESQPLAILYCPVEATRKPTSVKIVILPLCPWEFTPQDFHDFSSAGRFDDTTSHEWKSREWVNADRTWAYLYDLCLDCECPFFAITSYEQWIFGRFSRYYTNAWFSSTLKFDSRKPASVLELLIFCIHASFDKEPTFILPTVPLERNITDAHFERDLQAHSKRFLEFSGSGSDPIPSNSPPAKRPRKHPSCDSVPFRAAAQSRPIVRERNRRPPRQWKELHAFTKQMRPKTSTVDPSVAPSSSDPLPEEKIPHWKNSLCESWRQVVALAQNGSESNGIMPVPEDRLPLDDKDVVMGDPV